MRLTTLAVLFALPSCAQDLLPVPQKVNLTGARFRLTTSWRVDPGPHPDPAALDVLRDELAARCRLRLRDAGAGPAIRFELSPGAVAAPARVADEAYRLTLAPDAVRVLANASAGLFYGVTTLVQLLDGRATLPAGEIVDAPDLPYRAIYWDDAHHLDRLDYLKRAVRQAALFKINAFAIKLEGHFQYRSAPAIVEPYALSPAEFQELTDYGLRYHVQIVPYLDAPAHVAFILKHPEYAALREYPDINYEMCATNPEAIRLVTGMLQDLLDANRGVPYFYLSTDEPYYIGKAKNAQCSEADRAAELGSPGKLLAEFLDQTAGYLHDRGRTVLFWGEMPLKPADIPSLPPYLVNGETYGKDFDSAFRARGIREMIYTSTQGEEPIFPDYFLLPQSEKLHPGRPGKPRIDEAVAKIATDPARQDGDVIGVNVAAWADAGLHTETFWLGYATIAAAAWNPAPRETAAARAAFYRQFYGPAAVQMDRIYELLSRQAQWWSDTWDTVPSTSRKPIRGNSNGIYDAPRPARDQTLPVPIDARRLEIVATAARENSELQSLLNSNLRLPIRNRYSLEVFRTLAALCRHNLTFIQTLANPTPRAWATATADRTRVLRALTAVWEKTWRPRVAEANGRRFLHDLDDIKDHRPDRTIDMTYLVDRELRLRP